MNTDEILAIVVLFVLFFSAWQSIYLFTKIISSYFWPSTEAIVKICEFDYSAQQYSGNWGPYSWYMSYKLKVNASYKIKGKEYETEQTLRSRDLIRIQDKADTYKKGNTLKLYYNPFFPLRCIWEQDRTPLNIMLYLALSIGLLFLFLNVLAEFVPQLHSYGFVFFKV